MLHGMEKTPKLICGWKYQFVADLFSYLVQVFVNELYRQTLFSVETLISILIIDFKIDRHDQTIWSSFSHQLTL